MSKRNNVAAVWDECNLSYCDPNLKVTAHELAKTTLTEFAVDCLGLRTDEFSVRSNMGGIAVSGEVTLHTDAIDGEGLSVYVQVGQSCIGKTIMWRSCDDRKDYSGHHNRFGSVTALLGDDDARRNFARNIRQACQKPVTV